MNGLLIVRSTVGKRSHCYKLSTNDVRCIKTMRHGSVDRSNIFFRTCELRDFFLNKVLYHEDSHMITGIGVDGINILSPEISYDIRSQFSRNFELNI